jgi:DNA-binding NarL/FixJ family response regulator
VDTRIAIADDHVLFVQGLRALLTPERKMQVVAECGDGNDAVKVARKLKPDLVIMDNAMPGMNGIEATERITSEQPDVKVLCLSMHSAPCFVERAMQAGASGYLLKECAYQELIGAVGDVMANRMYLSPAIAGVVVNAMRRRQAGTTVRSPLRQLSDREREILQLLAEGYSAKAIGERLSLSVKTVSSHRQHIMDKLVIHNIAGLTKFALQEGLTSATPQEHPHY